MTLRITLLALRFTDVFQRFGNPQYVLFGLVVRESIKYECSRDINRQNHCCIEMMNFEIDLIGYFIHVSVMF